MDLLESLLRISLMSLLKPLEILVYNVTYLKILYMVGALRFQ